MEKVIYKIHAFVVSLWKSWLKYFPFHYDAYLYVQLRKNCTLTVLPPILTVMA
jgi:hypothetical protein